MLMCSAAQPCLTLCDPRGYSPPGSSVLGISQARILKWVDVSSSRGSSQPLVCYTAGSNSWCFPMGKPFFGSPLSFRFLRTQGYRGKRSGRRFESEQDYFTYTSLLLVEMCALMLLFGIFTKGKKIVIMNSVPWKVCFVLFCLFLCVMLKCALGHIKS